MAINNSATDSRFTEHATPPLDSPDDATIAQPSINHGPPSRIHYTLLVLLLAALISASITLPRPARAGPDIRVTNSVPPNRLRIGIDPNTAAWYEFAQLPGIGESLAREIVSFRTRRSAELGNAAVFRSEDELLGVRGIGRKTLRRVVRYLQFESNPTKGAE